MLLNKEKRIEKIKKDYDDGKFDEIIERLKKKS